MNDAEAQVNSTLITIMGRMSAYTGKDVTWEEVMNSDLYLGPKPMLRSGAGNYGDNTCNRC